MKTEMIRIWKPEEYSYDRAFGFIPKLNLYLHEDEKIRPCILIVPGGGYAAVSPTEGEPVALKFYEMGYQTAVLTYTTNFTRDVPLNRQPLQDISRAVRLIRRNAADYHVNPQQIAICGFSAGGHLCGSLCVHSDDIEDLDDAFNAVSNHPDAAILCYPVITSGEYAHRDSFVFLLGEQASDEDLAYMSLEKHVSNETPPCMIWATVTDELVPVENSILFAEACRAKDVHHALHLFSDGKHGLALANQDWADGKNQNPYTVEQLTLALKAVNPDLNMEVFFAQMMEKNQQESGGAANKPNPEVAVWPELADLFLRQLA